MKIETKLTFNNIVNTNIIWNYKIYGKYYCLKKIINTIWKYFYIYSDITTYIFEYNNTFYKSYRRRID